MLTDGVFYDSDAKDPIELTRLAGLSLARVSSALSAGESRGLFQRHLAPTRIGTGGSNTRWRLSASLTDLAVKFADFAEDASRFSQKIAEAASMHPPDDVARNVEFNLEVAKTVFGKWSVDILTLMYARKTLGYQEILHELPGMSGRVLSDKLSRLQELGLVHREVLDTKPPRVQYSFTEKGLRVAKLGEPVFLYLRFSEGLLFLAKDEEAAVR
jgi:DNA-binding HxlR family transcriptional regulator